MKALLSFLLAFFFQGCASVEENTHVPVNTIRGDQTVGEPQNFYCAIQVSSKKYEASGPTLLQTQKIVIDECKKHHTGVQCAEKDQGLNCKRNL